MRVTLTRRTAGSSQPDRRGAIVVMTGIMIVALMLIAAISVDASRIFAAKNELQTSADAAALAGALQMLRDSATAVDSARAFALRNSVEQQSVDSVRIELGVWRSASGFCPASDCSPVDAVRITTQRAIPLSLARVFGDTTLSLSASATAWSTAPIAAARCARPIALPYAALLHTLGYPPWNVDYDLTEDDILRLRNMPVGERDTIFHYGNDGRDDTVDDEPDPDDLDEYFPIDIDSTWNRSDPETDDRPTITSQSFQSYMSGVSCSRTVRPGDQVRAEPGNKATAMSDALGQDCVLRGGQWLGNRCATSTGDEMDLPIPVVFWRDVGEWHGGRVRITVKSVGSFVVRHIYDPSSTDVNVRASLDGYFTMRQGFGAVATGGSTLVRPILVW
jgi:Flp pilus assembly protein TadG